MYYIKYNEIDLTDIVKVRSVEIPSLPSITHSSFDVFERRGNIFNGVSYNERTITLKLIIQPDNPDDYDMYVNDVKRAFYVQGEQRLFCGDETLYMWCVPEGEINIIEIGNACAEAEIDLVAYDPYWYSTDYRTVNNDNLKVFNVNNDSDAEIFPIIKVGFSQSTTFFQMDNQSVGERFLLGKYPESGKEITERTPVILKDIMEQLENSGWDKWESLDGDRSPGSNISITEEGWGFTCTNFGNSTDDTWHGACYKKDLKQPIKDFRCGFTISHNSTGVNGDPTKVFYPFTDDEEVTTTTEPEYYYKVATSSGVDLRSGKDSVDDEGKVTQSPKIVTVPYGSEVTINDDENGWVNVTWESPNGYDGIGRHYSGWCKANNLKKYVRNKIVTEMRKNFVTKKSTAIRTTPSRYSVNKLTIPAGTCIRVLYSKPFPVEGDEAEDFYELAAPYNGQTGYVLVADLTEASDWPVEYEFEPETADDKTGAVEVYGYSNNNKQLFRLGMYDDNEYYENNYPVIRKNGEDFLSDKNFAPGPKTKTEYGNSGATITKTLSGQYGDWNDYYGDFHIERVDNRWSAFVTKIENGQVVKKICSNTLYDSTNENELLSYIVIFFGTMGSTEKASGMSISHCEVWTSWKELLEEGDDRTEDMFSFQEFKAGDVITIDNNVPSVFLNSIERNDLIDIGSSFFRLKPGNNTMKIASDDPNVNIDVIWKPKHL